VTIKPLNNIGTICKYDLIPDSGSSRTLIPLELVKKHKWKLNPSEDVIFAANNSVMKNNGQIDILVEFNGCETQIDALVSSDLKNNILIAWFDLVKMDILPKHFPNQIKINATESEIMNWKEVKDLMDEYSDVLKDTLSEKPIGGQKMTLELCENAKPRKFLTARRIPHHYEDEARKMIEQLIKDNIIAPQKKPTNWISPAFFVPKDNGKGLRLVCDFTASGLNSAVKRLIHPFNSASDIMQNIKPTSKYFLKADCLQGYHQILLDEKSQDLTTFILPFGVYYYKRCPMGLSGSGDIFCLKSDEALHGLEGLSKIIDDLLLEGSTPGELLQRFKNLLQRCREHNIILSKKKLQIAQDNLVFAGYIIGQNGIRPDPSKIAGISKFPTPKDITSLRSFLGLANQLGGFCPDMTHMTAVLRELLKKDVFFKWMPEHEECFQKIKKLLTSEMVIQPFNSDSDTYLLTDASKLYGIGYALMQKDSNGLKKLVQCGSRSLTSAETRYATIELELLAIQYAMLKCKHFLLGMQKFEVITDHKPLIGVLKRNLDSIENSRLQRMRLKLVDFNFTLLWNPGKLHLIADALSRNPVFNGLDELSEDIHTNAVIINSLQTDVHFTYLYEAVEKDEDYQMILQALTEGKKVNDLPPQHPAKMYANIWHDLSIYDGLIIKSDKQIVIPENDQKRILKLLHSPHSGEVKTLVQARQLYFWRNMSNSIKDMVSRCEKCINNSSSLPKEPLIYTEPSHPLSHVGVDLGEEGGRHYLIMVDSYSGYIWCNKLNNLHTRAITSQLENWFLDFGFCQNMRSDGGPQFRSEFEKWCLENNINYIPSSAYFPSSNGLVENGVKTCKNLLAKYDSNFSEFKKALHEQRNAPRSDGFSPAQMMFGRRQRGILPCLPSAYDLIDVTSAAQGRKRAREKIKQNFDKHAYSLPKLSIGESVFLQNPFNHKWDSIGKVIEVRHDGRSYKVEGNNGRVYLRNRRFLKPKKEDFEDPISDDQSSEDVENGHSQLSENEQSLRRSERLKNKKVRFSE